MLIKWTSRRFNFEFPVEHFPAILERVRGTPARIEELIRNKSEDSLSWRPPGGWSVKDHIGHLTDLEDLHEDRIDDYLDGNTELRPADMENKKTWEANHHKRPLTELLSDFRFARNIFVERLISVNPEFLRQVAQHPRLNKTMRVVDMVLFVAEHDDQHLARMREVISITPNRRKDD